MSAYYVIVERTTYVILVEKHVELFGADSEIGLVELVGNVPSEGPELPSLLHERVEETESKQQLLEMRRLFVPREELPVTDWIRQVRPVKKRPTIF